MQSIDRQNTTRLKEIIADIGWPTACKVASDGARAAWLLTQHADHDVAFQRRGLGMMETMLENDLVPPADVAYLTDRVLVNEGRPQRYGTQFHVSNGRFQPRPMEDPDKVDVRRKAMGLQTLKEYTSFMDT